MKGLPIPISDSSMAYMTKKLTDHETNKIIEKATNDFKGQIPVLESAIGALHIGRKFGWKVLYIVHDTRTIKKYEDILGINFRGTFDEAGPLAHKSKGYQAVTKLSNFWKAVKGETTIKNRKDAE
jgi:hypothetical protein